MKVHLITAEPFPKGMAATQRVFCYAKALIEAGVDCKVYPFRRTESIGKINNPENDGVVDGVPFEYLCRSNVRSKNHLINFINEYKDKLVSAIRIYNIIERGDVVFFYCGAHILFMLAVMKLAKRKRVKCIRDLCEYPFITKQETKLSKILRKITLKTQFPKIDGVITISDTLTDLAKEYIRDPRLVIKIPILVNFKQYAMADKSSESNEPFIFHSGTLTEQKDGVVGMLTAFGEAISQIDERVKFVSTGNLDRSPVKREITQVIEKYHLQNRVVFTGYLSDFDMKTYLSKATLVIVNKYPTTQNKYCFSTKLGEYSAASKPIILTDYGEAINYFKNGESAIVVKTGDTPSLTDAIITLFCDEKLRIKIGEKAQNVCRESFDYKQWSTPLLVYLKNVVNS